MSSWFAQAYSSIDRRVLGSFRILYGTVLLYDLVRRALDFRLLYSNDGVLANHFLLFAPQVPNQFSLYFAFSTPGEVLVAFSLTALVYVAYTVGLFTRWSQVLALLCLTSLNQRNLFFEDGGMSTMIALAVWTLFLPLGDAYSADAMLRDARLPTVRARTQARAEVAATPAKSLAVLAIILQIVTIYVFNVLHKTGDTWRDGTAVHYVLWQNRVNTAFGNWLAFHEPPYFSALATRGTLLFESLIPALVLWPTHRAFVRSFAFVLAVMLHGGIAVVMTLGPFSYAMIALVSLMLPISAYQRLLRFVPKRFVRRALRARARLVHWLRREELVRNDAPNESPARQFKGRVFRGIRESAVALMMIISAFEVCRNNWAVRSVIEIDGPQAFSNVVGGLRMIQSWRMFAPDAPVDDGMMVIDAELASGAHVDPFTGRPPDFRTGVRSPVPESIMQTDYLFAMRVGNEKYRDQLRQFMSRWHDYSGRPRSDRIVRYDVYWINHRSPPIGSVEPTNYVKELMFSGP